MISDVNDRELYWTNKSRGGLYTALYTIKTIHIQGLFWWAVKLWSRCKGCFRSELQDPASNCPSLATLLGFPSETWHRWLGTGRTLSSMQQTLIQLSTKFPFGGTLSKLSSAGHWSTAWPAMWSDIDHENCLHEVYFRQNVHRNNKEERKEPTHTHTHTIQYLWIRRTVATGIKHTY